MSQDHRLQQQRFELKYLVDEAITPALRDFVSSYLELDDFGAGRPNMSYPVHSVYLDSDDLQTYQAAVNGTRNRFKLRLRYYNDDPDAPVFFEVKARVDNCILKQRCGVRRDAVAILVGGQLPEPKHLLSREPRHLVALQHFNLLQMQLDARPKAHNQYLREAWVSPEVNSIRVTMDRNVRIEPYFTAKAVTEMTRPVQIFPEFTIVELKFTARYPKWFSELVQRFDLMQSSSAKYVEGVALLGEHRFHDGETALDEQGRLLREYDLASEPIPALASKPKQTAAYE
jgi:SPX domain protein involved in polyphosphate accumulation